MVAALRESPVNARARAHAPTGVELRARVYTRDNDSYTPYARVHACKRVRVYTRTHPRATHT